MEFYATCPAGFEQLLASELRSLHIPAVRPLRGQVAFAGELDAGYRVCLWSRLASRVVLVLARGGAADADELYQTVAGVAWEGHLAPGGHFAIDASGTNEKLRNTQFVSLRAKDALVDHMLARTGTRPVSDTARPDLRLVVRIARERASVGIDLSGTPLFRRGYEASSQRRLARPPLRSDYAAALLVLGGWPQICSQTDAVLAAPFVGSGSIAVEAAGMARAQAPGLMRLRWGFDGWLGHDASVWEALVREARERTEASQAHPTLWLDDPLGNVQGEVRHALRAAGLEIEPYVATVDAAHAPAGASHGGASLLVADLSWIGESELARKAAALQALAQAHEALGRGARTVVLAPDELSDLLLGTPRQVLASKLGNSDVSLRAYGTTLGDASLSAHAEPASGADAPRPVASSSSDAAASGEGPHMHRVTLPDQRQVPVLVAGSEQFVARLRKVYKLRRKWAQREDVSCYRVYDADLPDYAVSIELFQGSATPGTWLQIFEYAPPKSVDVRLAQARLLDVVSLAPQILGVSAEHTFVRVRTRARGGSQYADEAQAPRRDAERGRGQRPQQVLLPRGAHLVDEGGLTFEVNFSLRLDCGIFLDHRDTRAMLREMAKQTKGSKRFLNLFAYTGTATCYAADGGAKHTTTVDLSRPSLDWAQRNMARNGFVGPEHEFVQADVIRWVGEQRRTRNRWDLVFCDVPTFSNSRRMGKTSFDVQRDHAELLIGISRLLTRDGVCVFSCNLRSFRIDEAALAKAGVVAEDISARTIPEDFARNQKIHHCYLVRRTPMEG